MLSSISHQPAGLNFLLLTLMLPYQNFLAGTAGLAVIKQKRLLVSADGSPTLRHISKAAWAGDVSSQPDTSTAGPTCCLLGAGIDIIMDIG